MDDKPMGVSPIDYKFLPAQADPGFSAERNRKIIEETIKKNDKLRKSKLKKFQDELGERNDAITSWAKSLNHDGKPIDQYLGRAWMTKFVGERIQNKLANRLLEIWEKNPNII